MVNIGTKLQVPPQNDERAWKAFYDQVMTPGYSTDIYALDLGRDVKNKHWSVCQLKATAKGCERCREVEKRNPEMDWNIYGKD